MKAPAQAVRYSGWYRAGRGRRWVKLVAGAAAFGGCWQALLDRLPREGPGGESLVTVAGKDPNDTPRGRRGR